MESEVSVVANNDEIIKSIKDTVLHKKDVNTIKEAIVSYIEVQKAVSVDSSQLLVESCKQLAQKMVQVQESLDHDLSAESLQNSSQKASDEKNCIQLQADKKEVMRRINSFITRKRKQTDDWNVQEFCNHHSIEEENPLWDEINTCARVDAVFVPRSGSKSHVKVSKVNNTLGPQIHLQNSVTTSMNVKAEIVPSEFSQFESESIEERLRNMESHLKLKSDGSARRNTYARLKQLEDRILDLESSSPEYLNFLGTKMSSPEKPNKAEEPIYYTSNSSRLYKRVQTLKEELKWKSRKLSSDSPS